MQIDGTYQIKLVLLRSNIDPVSGLMLITRPFLPNFDEILHGTSEDCYLSMLHD